MKKISNIYYEVYFLKNIIFNFLKEQIKDQNESIYTIDSMWAGRTLYFFNNFYKKTTENSVIIDYLDFSLSNVINLSILNNNEYLLKYLYELPGQKTQHIEEIKKISKDYLFYKKILKENNSLIPDKELIQLIEMNNINYQNIQSLENRKNIHFLNEISKTCFEQHGFLSVMIEYVIDNNIENLSSKYKFSTFSKNSHFFLNLITEKKITPKEIKDFIFENELNMTNLEENEKQLIEINFN